MVKQTQKSWKEFNIFCEHCDARLTVFIAPHWEAMSGIFRCPGCNNVNFVSYRDTKSPSHGVQKIDRDI